MMCRQFSSDLPRLARSGYARLGAPRSPSPVRHHVEHGQRGRRTVLRRGRGGHRRRLRDIVKEEDPTLPTTASMNYPTPPLPFPAALDIITLNYQGEGSATLLNMRTCRGFARHPSILPSTAGTIVATDNGDPTSFVPFQSRERDAFNGLALATSGRGRRRKRPSGWST